MMQKTFKMYMSGPPMAKAVKNPTPKIGKSNVVESLSMAAW